MDDMTKKADNTFIERKVKISDIDEKIDIERANLKKIDSLYDSAYSLNKSILIKIRNCCTKNSNNYI